jgi:hypothetical protein
MDSAARLPAATASITDEGPEALSPPAKTPSIVFYLCVADELLIGHLADCNDDLLCSNFDNVVFVKSGIEAFIVVEDPCAAFELHACD